MSTTMFPLVMMIMTRWSWLPLMFPLRQTSAGALLTTGSFPQGDFNRSSSQSPRFSHTLFCFQTGWSLYLQGKINTLLRYFSRWCHCKKNNKINEVDTHRALPAAVELASRVCLWTTPSNHTAVANLFINVRFVVLPGSGRLIQFSLTVDCIIWENKAPAKTNKPRTLEIGL